MADRGRLPLIAAERAGAKEGAGDVQLGGAVTRGIESAQHVPRPDALLGSQALIGRNAPAVDGGKQAIDSVKPGEAICVERNDCGKGRAVGGEDLNAFDRTQRDQAMDALLVVLDVAEVKWPKRSPGLQDCR